MSEDYIEDKKKEFEKLKAEKDKQQKVRPLTPKANSAYDFAKEISLQQTAETSDDEDPGLSDIPKPGTNVSAIMGQSSSERILTKTKPSGKYIPFKKKDKNQKKDQMPSDHPPSNRRQRSNSQQISQKTVNEVHK